MSETKSSREGRRGLIKQQQAAKSEEQIEAERRAEAAEALARRKMEQEAEEKALFMAKYTVRPAAKTKSLKTKHILQEYMKYTAPETHDQRQHKVISVPRLQKTKENGRVIGISGFTAGDIPAMQRGTEVMVAQAHKEMNKVKKRYNGGEYDAILGNFSKQPGQLQLQVPNPTAENHCCIFPEKNVGLS